MKKLLLVLLILVVVGMSAFAFDPLSYPPALGGGGNLLLDAGVGYWLGLGVYGGGIGLGILPLFAQLEYALPVEVPISVGGGISFFRLSDRYDTTYALTYITPQARASWHWGFDVPWLDLYTGIALGYNIVTLSAGYYGSATAASSLYYAFHTGAHFYFSERVGAMVEIGYPFLKAGVAFKLGNQRFGRVSSSASARGNAAVTTDVNMRSGPGLDYPVITSLREGTLVTLTGEIISGWTEVIYNGRRGWISSPFLTTR
jgi:hypothetical protein